MPTSYRVILSARAFADLHAILDYIEKDSPQNALKMLDRLWDAAHSLRDFPHRYPVFQGSPRAREQTRVMPVPPYLIYYRVVERQNLVRVITVRHCARRRPRKF